MSETVRRSNSIWKTPIRDLIRGRITGRLDWEGRLRHAALPDAARDLIRRVVKRTRLWRLEKASVADELIAHFADALEAGRDAESVIKRFGDERAAAKLIRRAKKRNRPLAWQVWRYIARGAMVLFSLYAIVLVRFLLSQPTVRVDYVAKLNAPIEQAPLDQRAWPLLRQCSIACGLADESPAIEARIGRKDKSGYNVELSEALPTDPEWPQLAAWLDAHRDAIELLRQAARKPVFGFLFGRAGSYDDPELQMGPHAPRRLAYEAKHRIPPPEKDPADDTMLSQVLLPELNYTSTLSDVLLADARMAVVKGDATRFEADVMANLNLASCTDSPFVVSRLVSISFYHKLFVALQKVLQEQPELLTDKQWVQIAHRVAGIAGDTASSLIDLRSERFLFKDMLQRIYSDDGNGDGSLTRSGAKLLAFYTGTFGSDPNLSRQNYWDVMIANTGLSSVITSRKRVSVEFDRLMDLTELTFAKPLRTAPAGVNPFAAVEDRLKEIRRSPILRLRFLPIAIQMTSYSRAAQAAEQLLGERDGLGVGIALELYRRRNGGYPASLGELAPAYLPAIPADRIRGGPVKYRVLDGKPIVYSVGMDGVDDGGVPQTDAKGQAISTGFWWPKRTDVHGDWVLFGSVKSADFSADSRAAGR